MGLYLFLVVGGITTSSLGHALLRQDPAHPKGTAFGVAQSIRSDEFLTDTPIVIGRIATGSGYDTNPLTEEPGLIQQLPTGPTTGLTFFDGTVFRATAFIPDAMLFAMRWWLPALLLFIFTPLWFREVTGRARFGVLCAGLVFFAPSNTWWSYRATAILGFLFAACYLVLISARTFQDRRRVAAVGLALLAGIGIARYPSNYQPFAIVAGLPVVVATLLRLLRQTELRRSVRVGTVALVGLIAAALFAGSLIENWSSLSAALDTVYPGQRRLTGGGAHEPWMLFSAPALGSLLTTEPVVGSNASEISTAFTVTALWAAILLTSGRLRRALDRWTVGVFMVSTAFWISWMVFDWGGLGLRLPVVNRVDPHRAMAMVGTVAAVAACLVLSWWRRPGSWRGPAVSGVLIAAATAWGAVSLRGAHYPSLPWSTIVISSLVAGGCVAAITLRPDRMWPLALTFAALVALTIRVNPIVVGLGDLRADTTATAMLEHGDEARQKGIAWASDFVGFDSLMFATGTPSVSGRQQSGPDARMWRRLDPTGAGKDRWNRGGAYIFLQWGSGRDVQIVNPSPDVIVVTINACELHRRIPAVRVIAAARPLSDSCLRERETLPWAGNTMHVYDIREGAA